MLTLEAQLCYFSFPLLLKLPNSYRTPGKHPHTGVVLQGSGSRQALDQLHDARFA